MPFREFKENIVEIRKGKIEEIERFKENETKNISQQRQENISKLSEKKLRVEGLLSDLKKQHERAKSIAGELKGANKEISEILKEDKEYSPEIRAFKETTKKDFVRAVRAGDYGNADNPVNARDQKAEELRTVIRKSPQEGVFREVKSQTIVELKKEIKKELPEVKISFRSKEAFPQIESEIFKIEREMKNLVEESVIERHKNGLIDLSPDDLRDMKILGKDKIKDIILEQAQKPIEEKCSGKLKLLEGKILEEKIRGFLRENIVLVAEREKALAGRSLDKNLLALENQEAEAKNSKVYEKVEDYYKKIDDLGNIVKQLEKGMRGYNYDFSIGEDQSLTMSTLDKAVGEWEKTKADRIIEKSGQDGQGGLEGEIKKFSSGFWNKISFGKIRHKKEIGVANKKISEINDNIKFLENGLAGMKEIQENSQKKLREFFTTIPKEWLENGKFSKDIFKKHERAEYLTNTVSAMKYDPERFGVISQEDRKAHDELKQQRAILEEVKKDVTGASESLEKAKTEAAKFEKEYLS